MRRLAASASISIMLVLTACSTASPSRAGGVSPPVTLRAVAAADAGLPGGDQLADFAARVAQLSAGSITVQSLPATGSAHERDAAEMVQSARADLGVVPVRALETLGVTTTRALAAPLLIDRNSVADATLADPLSSEMLAGFSPIGVTGLALTFDSLRQPLGTPKPLREPSDFAGAVIAVVPGDADRDAAYAALGATISHAVDAELTVGIHEGRIQGRDGSTQVVPGATAGTVTANAVIGLKALAVVANSKAFAGLTTEQQDALRRAAEQTRDAAASRHLSLAESARDYCAAGHGDVVVASDQQLQAMKTAMASVYRDLQADPFTARAIERIRQLDAQLPAQPAPSACSSSTSTTVATPTSSASSDDQKAIDGIWRYEVKLDPKADRPDAAREASRNNGTWTIQFNNGHRLSIENSGISHEGTYRLTGDHITIVDDDGATAEYLWHRQGDTMTWKPAPGAWSPVDAELETALLAEPMRRIGDATIEPGTGS